MKMILTQGVPASGKSTWAKAYVKAMPDYVRINRDDIRMSVFGVEHGCDEKAVTKIQDSMIRAALSSGKNVIVDNTNIEPKFVSALADIGHEYHAEVEIKRFDVTLDEALRRNAARERKVPDDVIRKMHKRLSENKYDVSNRFDRVLPSELYSRAELFDAIIVDIDGTLAHNNGKRGFYDWAKVGSDDVDEVIAGIALTERDENGTFIIIVSGRDGSCREETIRWLHDNDVYFDMLLMREAGDMRKDDIVKYELFNKHIRNQFNVKYVLDDRDQVVRMWRRVGLKVLQVADGDF